MVAIGSVRQKLVVTDGNVGGTKKSVWRKEVVTNGDVGGIKKGVWQKTVVTELEDDVGGKGYFGRW